MSWQAWADNMVQQGAFYCGIHGRDGNPWAACNMNLQQSEAAKLEEIIRKNDQSVYGSGVTLNGHKWTVVRLEEDTNTLVIKGKEDANKESTMTICLTKGALVFGANKDSTHSGNQIRSVVEATRTNLSNLGY